MEAGGFLYMFVCCSIPWLPSSTCQRVAGFFTQRSSTQRFNGAERASFMPARVPQPGENDDEVSSLKPRLLDSERLDFSVTLDSQGQNDLFTAFVHEYAPLGCPG